ncbi:MAG: hydantoinase/oxoprolinase family protein [Rhodobacteraceae bacterium]|nr:hydantoinase/oxoprolinase family protein [Paracoccaceae bacterium]
MTFVAGVDVGGTFTDLVAVDQATGAVRLAKVPTSLPNQAPGVLAAFDAADIALADVGLVVHGTTTTTNAVLERQLARTGLITTEGFRDVLELGRRTRPNAYGMTGRFVPVIPRDLRLEVPERMDAQGQVVTALDEDAVRAAVTRLVAEGCEALVIHFLHAYANPAHEVRAVEIARDLWPTPYITAGHQLLSESREFERGVTAAVNAGVQPVLERYIARLQDGLREQRYGRDLLVVNGNGGMVAAASVAREAVKTVMSGPASGVMAAAYTGRRAGVPDLVTYDMGGTSTDVALIRGGRVPVSNEIEVEYAMPIHVPMVDVRTVGAGGGSIARVDAGGMLRVGPESAGSTPGPICYGRGGTRPTISDANLLLGRLSPDRIGAQMDAVRAAFARDIGAPLGLLAEDAAAAVIRLANVHMAGAIRMVSVSLGADPRDFALFAFGGAGPLHATALARELAIPRVLVPARPGLTNALGCVVADLRHDFVRTLNRPLDTLDMAEAAEVLAAMEAAGRRLMPDRAALRAAFEAAYFARFRVELPEIRPRLVNLNVSVIGVRPGLDLRALLDPAARVASVDQAQTGTRPVWFDGWRETPVYDRVKLPLDAAIEGPAIVEQMDTTLVIDPGDSAAPDAEGNLIVTIGGAA